MADENPSGWIRAMKLSTRMFVILMPAVAAGLGAIFWVAGTVIVDGFEGIEETAAENDLQRIREAVDADRDALDRTARDWAHWDDTYRFVQRGYPEYVDVDLAPKSFAAYHLSFMLYLDAQGEIVYGSGFDATNETYGPLPATLAQPNSRHDVGLPELSSVDGHVTGLVRLGDEIHFVSSWAVLDSFEEGPAVGTMTWGRRVDDAYAETLSSQTKQQVALSGWDASAQATPRGATIARVDSDHLTGSTLLEDLQGGPILLLRMDQDRPVYQEGIRSITYFVGSSLAIALGFLVLGTALLNRFVTGRVVRLGRYMSALRAGTAVEDRAGLGGSDEVALMSQEFDRLMRELLRRRADLERSNQDLKEFASVVTHDLKSPLATVAINLAILKRNAAAAGDHKSLETIDRIQRTADRMAERITAVLDYSRETTREAKMDPVALGPLVQEVLRDLTSDIERTKANVTVGELPEVHGDRHQLAQVFQNLLANAMKYHRPGVSPVVHVRAEERDGRWAIHVEDRGMGFRREEFAAMIAPFQRLENSQGIPGHGVGLATCARVLERHGGALEGEGRPGEGARFTFHLAKAPRASA